MATIAGGLYSRTPMAMARGEARKETRLAQMNEKAAQKLKNATYKGTPAEQERLKDVASGLQQEYEGAGLELRKKAAMAYPTQSTVKNYVRRYAGAEAAEERRILNEGYSQDEANAHMQEEGNRQLEQNQVFNQLMERLKADQHPAYSGKLFNKLDEEKQKDVVTRLMAGGAK